MGAMGWPSESELNVIRMKVAEMSGRDSKEVRIVVSPYRICPLGAHIDHQGGIVSAMTINKGILLGFVLSNDSQVLLQSGQFKGEVRLSVGEVQLPGNTFSTDEECNWGNYARGALYALQKRGNHIKRGIIGFICGAEGLDSSGLSSSAAALITNPGYNSRVAECREAARVLLQASGNEGLEPLLSNVEPEAYEEHKCKLDPNLAKRAEHYFSENKRVVKAVEAWALGNMEDFGKLISASGLSSIRNYESGCEPLIQLYEILVKAPGVYGARFSGAGFRGCCIAFVDAGRTLDAASFIWREYSKVQPKLSSQMDEESMVLICDAGDCARVI